MELHQITTRCPFQPTACYDFSYYSTKFQEGGESIWNWPAEVLDNFQAGWLTDPFFYEGEWDGQKWTYGVIK